ncbi:hypothetical protein J4214_00990 [Candidatus Woesearchaeota archaeon]|nr:hypothetical protein [Candidatus Woesearchaeota archaeon]
MGERGERKWLQEEEQLEKLRLDQRLDLRQDQNRDQEEDNKVVFLKLLFFFSNLF